MTALSIIVPVQNEAARIVATSRLLLAGLPQEAELIFVVNGCSDDSEALLRRGAGRRARIIGSHSGKANALNAGDAAATKFPRFYIDADVEITGTSVAALAERLRSTGAMLISPRLKQDLAGASRAARAVNRVWMALPHARSAAFHQVIGVSAAGRANWGALPGILADDSYMVAAVPAESRTMADDIVARVRPPWTLRDFVRVRSRWRTGQRQLEVMGIAIVYQPDQRAVLLRQLLSPTLAAPAVLYVLAVLVGNLLARIAPTRVDTWYQDQSTRRIERSK